MISAWEIISLAGDLEDLTCTDVSSAVAVAFKFMFSVFEVP
jgi:hypothetical protein